MHGRGDPQITVPAISHRNYLIVCEVATDEVIIHYVRHGARRRPWEGE